MPDPRAHPSTEQLADLVEGLLSDAEAVAASTHLQGCAQCAEVHRRLQALPALLAATPSVSMPPELATRLDDALGAEARRRSARVAPDSVVVPLRRLRRDRVRHVLAGAATAAAALLVVSVLPDVLDTGGSDGMSTSGGEAADRGAAGPDRERAPTAAAERDRLAGAVRALPDVSTAGFAGDVELLYDSGSASFLSGVPQDGPGNPPAGQAVRLPHPESVERLVPTAGCAGPALRSAGVRGVLGSLVRLDGEVARLVASGPSARREVAAYSCASGDRLAGATLDLSRR